MPQAFRSLTAAVALLVSLCLLAALPRGASDAVYPGTTWEKVADVERAGWSRTGLKAAEDYSRTIQTAAVMVVSGGRVVAEWGEPTRRFNVHSIRKSFLSALYG